MNTSNEKESMQPHDKNKNKPVKNDPSINKNTHETAQKPDNMGTKNEGGNKNATKGEQKGNDRNQQRGNQGENKQNQPKGHQQENNSNKQGSFDNQEPVEEKSNNIKNQANGGNNEPEITTPVYDPGKTEKKIPKM